MSKPKRIKNYDAIAEARLRNAGMPARKARLVLDLIRGKSVPDAFKILSVTHKPSAAPAVLKLLKSAVANARVKDSLEPEQLVVATAFADGGMMLKRLRPAPMGRGVRVRKRTCHITIRLNEI
jgi:large subunit ribosomal protein L22